MKKTDHKTRNLLLWILAGLLGAGLLVWAFTPKPVLVEIAKVQRGPYDQLVIEEGKTRAKEIFEILSPVSGDLERVQVHEGDTVKKGDVLAVVEWPNPWEIHSPIDGRVLRVKRESGGPIERGNVIMEVADPNYLEVVAEVLTDDAIHIKPGAPVRIESWGGCEPLKGKVRLIEPAAFTKVSALGVEEQRVKVIIDFTSPKGKCEGLADGFRVNNLISTFQAPDALTIPTGALFRDREKWAVFRVVNGRAKKTQVEIPRRNPKVAMVGAGLQEGDQVIVYPSDEIEDGRRVEALRNAE
jgi:HlyD family secretion protein